MAATVAAAVAKAEAGSAAAVEAARVAATAQGAEEAASLLLDLLYLGTVGTSALGCGAVLAEGVLGWAAWCLGSARALGAGAGHPAFVCRAVPP